MTKLESSETIAGALSSFVLRHSFVIRHSVICHLSQAFEQPRAVVIIAQSGKETIS
jgi:hypothetical protein